MVAIASRPEHNCAIQKAEMIQITRAYVQHFDMTVNCYLNKILDHHHNHNSQVTASRNLMNLIGSQNCMRRTQKESINASILHYGPLPSLRRLKQRMGQVSQGACILRPTQHSCGKRKASNLNQLCWNRRESELEQQGADGVDGGSSSDRTVYPTDMRAQSNDPEREL
jgi:hypothetical protein